jgi:hypothetical protein
MDLKGSGHSLVKVPSWHFPGGKGKPWKPLVRIAGIPLQIKSEHHPNTSLDHYGQLLLCHPVQWLCVLHTLQMVHWPFHCVWPIPTSGCLVSYKRKQGSFQILLPQGGAQYTPSMYPECPVLCLQHVNIGLSWVKLIQYPTTHPLTLFFKHKF